MLAATVSRLANHVLAPADWARHKLAAHAGKVALFDVFPAKVSLQVDTEGLLQPAASDAVPDATIRMGQAALLQALRDREQAWRQAEVHGDTEFAAAISQVAANLEWDVEEDLSRVFGDVAAHRMAEAGRVVAAWPGQAATSVAGNVAEYLTEEARLLVTPLDAADFIREVDELRDATERLEKRIEILARRLSAR